MYCAVPASAVNICDNKKFLQCWSLRSDCSESIEFEPRWTKNALDWLDGCGALDGKPTLLLSASPGNTGGVQGLVALFPTLQMLGAVLIDPVSVSRAASRLTSDGSVLDPTVYQRVELAMDDLRAAMDFAYGHPLAGWSLQDS